ncbi:hypothetical protein LIS77_02830 [Cytobacillus firmus]|uniref:hypothetical protein n=1 Tax=Cytobacillus firmus TaxID=1399 RepID=UPI00207A53A5|nr:hypothetical protein [Cytobacillus firmus]USK39484.1 hypothetical protein LIS77_02830 [Cytobacillus firmus]
MQNESGNGPVYLRADFTYVRHLSVCQLGNRRQFHGDPRRDDDGKLFLFPCEDREEGRLRVMEFMIFLFVFFIFLAISSVMNMLFKMTEKKHWGMSLLLSLVLAVITIAILGIK